MAPNRARKNRPSANRGSGRLCRIQALPLPDRDLAPTRPVRPKHRSRRRRVPRPAVAPSLAAPYRPPRCRTSPGPCAPVPANQRRPRAAPQGQQPIVKSSTHRASTQLASASESRQKRASPPIAAISLSPRASAFHPTSEPCAFRVGNAFLRSAYRWCRASLPKPAGPHDCTVVANPQYHACRSRKRRPPTQRFNQYLVRHTTKLLRSLDHTNAI